MRSLSLRPNDSLTIPRMALSIDFQGSVSFPPGYPSRVGGGALARWPPSAAQTARADFPHAAFTEMRRQRRLSEGIRKTKRTSPIAP